MVIRLLLFEMHMNFPEERKTLVLIGQLYSYHSLIFAQMHS